MQSVIVRLTALLVAVGSTAVPGFAQDWGTLKGRFVFGGDPPVAAPLTVDKDVEVCGKHKLAAEDLVVGPDKGVAGVVVFARDEELKGDPAVALGGLLLDNKDCRFEPHVMVVQAGVELTVKNSDPVAHNVNMSPLKNNAFNQIIPPGQEIKVTFPKGESRPFSAVCNIHPWMKGWVMVSATPFAAASAADGSFEIKGLPPGEVEFVFTHEKGYVREVETAAGKSDKKGRLTVTIKPGVNDLGEIVIAPTTFK